jgi:hypothetical protein
MDWLTDDGVGAHVAAGRRVSAGDDWAAILRGYHPYYASRCSSPALALVVEALRLVQSQ